MAIDIFCLSQAYERSEDPLYALELLGWTATYLWPMCTTKHTKAAFSVWDDCGLLTVPDFPKKVDSRQSHSLIRKTFHSECNRHLNNASPSGITNPSMHSTTSSTSLHCRFFESLAQSWVLRLQTGTKKGHCIAELRWFSEICRCALCALAKVMRRKRKVCCFLVSIPASCTPLLHKACIKACDGHSHSVDVTGGALAKFVTKSLRCMGCKAGEGSHITDRWVKFQQCLCRFLGWFPPICIQAIIKAGLLCEHCEKEKAADVASLCSLWHFLLFGASVWLYIFWQVAFACLDTFKEASFSNCLIVWGSDWADGELPSEGGRVQPPVDTMPAMPRTNVKWSAFSPTVL